MFTTPEKSLAPPVLFLELESYMSCITLDYKNLNYKINTTILRSCVKKSLHVIICERESAAAKNRTILHIFSTIQDVTDVSNMITCNLASISLNVLGK